MKIDFEQSTPIAPKPKKHLVFVSDFQGTIEGNGINFPLLMLLADAKASGHRVIFTSTSALYAVTSFLRLLPKAGASRDINLDPIQNIIDDGDVRAKHDLHRLTDASGNSLDFDFVFDDNPVTYVQPQHEIRVTPPSTTGGDFKTSPLSLAQIRNDYLKGGGTVINSHHPAPNR